MSKPVVLIAEELSPATIDALGPDFEIRHCNGADRGELLSAIADVDAILIRSATKVDAEAVAAARRLRVVARAGVGLDNVDVSAATKAGVMVVNAPTSNIVTAAELACGLIVATARNIPQANAALKGGEWKRSKYTGVELSEKILGVVGLGRIGVLVAQRMSAFGMKIVAYDPYVQPARAAQMGVKLVTLDELLEVSDFITVHLPKTPETLGLIGDEALRKVKPSVRVINAARGGIVDEDALAAALKDGRVAGAGLDVYATEPCTDSPLFAFDQVVATPHLGASTGEAQEKAGVAVARSVRLALAGELVPDAVNVQGGVIAEDVRPGLPLAEKLGRIFTALAGEVAVRLDVEVYGELTQHDVKVLELSALKGVFEDVVDETVSYVNAPLFAQERGVEVRLTTSSDSPDHRNVVTVRGTLGSGEEVSVSGTLAGPKHQQKIVGVGEHDIDLNLADHMAFLRYADRPGVVGTVGKVLGEAGINIAGMQVSRAEEGGEALVALTVDDTVPPAVLTEIAEQIGATSARTVNLV
ncbi:phosphoglycerate dehydrogenase [Streptomyces alkaliterrae]|uniref:D-3-phosphoglycerate dehydrogenase n=1 Tax=Streptomyces alkaliterrae TaxID=2213162 RepID=A0A5P0YRY1_9ACTN|nr:phosphoglycerate dehydrogenase [Streptomyces alkaliterrae]MBB1256259.1 phosphoglycerate dehydrogenase [Streptomyces alkaliterrae]MBB1261118.1 phosphoglycerate dehydrogenase [Streptomyces alkaliterrae]MQS03076.1 phosphoglycerate dehydrogenase [Streptomyces alkaliterrae]